MAKNGISDNWTNAESTERRLQMINCQLRTSDVSDSEVLAAFMAVPREAFVAAGLARQAYLDRDILAAGATSRKLLAPRTVARLVQAAAVKPGDRALEVGGGSGYAAALLSELGAAVVALESDPGAVAAARSALSGRDGVSVIQGDLDKGAPGHGPFDVIVLNGAFEAAPQGLLDQLAEGGRFVGLDAQAGAIRGVLIEKTGKGTSARSLFDASGDVLPGLAKAASFAF